jgi:hypothetical protein
MQTWKDVDNQRLFLEWMSTPLKVNHLKDWYFVTASDVQSLGGFALLAQYGHSVVKMLCNVNPTFHAFDEHFWKEKQNYRWFLDSVTPKIGVTSLEDWYTVDLAQGTRL